jgi:hypothetical protein
MKVRPRALADERFAPVKGARTSLALGMPFLVMIISSPSKAYSTSEESCVLAS